MNLLFVFRFSQSLTHSLPKGIGDHTIVSLGLICLEGVSLTHSLPKGIGDLFRFRCHGCSYGCP